MKPQQHAADDAASAQRRAWRKLIGRRDTKLLYAALADLCDSEGRGQVSVNQMVNHTSLLGHRLRNAIADLNHRGLATLTEVEQGAYQCELYLPAIIPPGGYAA